MPVLPVTDLSTQPVGSGTSNWSIEELGAALEEPQDTENSDTIPKTRIGKELLISNSSSHIPSTSSLVSKAVTCVLLLASCGAGSMPRRREIEIAQAASALRNFSRYWTLARRRAWVRTSRFYGGSVVPPWRCAGTCRAE